MLPTFSLRLPVSLKDTYKENTQMIPKNMNMAILVVRISNKLFLRGSYTQIRLSKYKVASSKTSFFLTGPYCTVYSICLDIGFRQGILVWKFTLSISI